MLRVLLAAAVVIGVSVLPAGAEPIGPDDCVNDTCQGAVYTLESFLLQNNAVEDFYAIRLTIDTENLDTDPDAAFAIDSVAVKTTAQNDAWVGGFDLSVGPGGEASWQQVLGGVNADGCSGDGGGFFCEDWIGAGFGAPVGGILTWIWTGLVDPDDLLDGSFEASIKARFVNEEGGKTGELLSENITLQPGPPGVDPRVIPIPEPTTLVLLGSGLVGSALARRRRK